MAAPDGGADGGMRTIMKGGEVGVTSNKGARRRLCYLSALVEVAAGAFLATELDDVAEGAIGGVADQPKTTRDSGPRRSTALWPQE